MHPGSQLDGLSTLCQIKGSTKSTAAIAATAADVGARHPLATTPEATKHKADEMSRAPVHGARMDVSSCA
jgi:hypothetical protein